MIISEYVTAAVWDPSSAGQHSSDVQTNSNIYRNVIKLKYSENVKMLNLYLILFLVLESSLGVNITVRVTDVDDIDNCEDFFERFEVRQHLSDVRSGKPKPILFIIMTL